MKINQKQSITLPRTLSKRPKDVKETALDVKDNVELGQTLDEPDYVGLASAAGGAVAGGMGVGYLGMAAGVNIAATAAVEGAKSTLEAVLLFLPNVYVGALVGGAVGSCNWNGCRWSAR